MVRYIFQVLLFESCYSFNSVVWDRRAKGRGNVTRKLKLGPKLSLNICFKNIIGIFLASF